MTQLVKWKQLYKVVFKEEDSQPKIITPEAYKGIKKDLFNNKWIELDGELYNPFLIKKIVKYETQDGIVQLIKEESEDIQEKVREFMRLYKKKLTV